VGIGALSCFIAKSINFDLILWIDFGYMTLFLRETGRENRYQLFGWFRYTSMMCVTDTGTVFAMLCLMDGLSA
jgi:hypothetical protein